MKKTSNIFIPILCLCFLLSIGKVKANNLDKKPDRDSLSFFAAYPLAFYFPETRLGLGGAALYTYRADKDERNKASNVQFAAGYTWNRQLLLLGTFNLWRNQNKQLFNGEVGFYDYFYPYYGNGSTSEVGALENYFVRFPRLKAKYLFLNHYGFYWGPAIHFDAYNIYDVETDGILDNNIVNGSGGGIVSGAGLAATLDRRDVQFYPTKGQFLEASLLYYTSILGSEYSYPRFSLTFSQYLPVSDKLTLALNYFQEYAGEDAPFQELALFGGPKYARGFVVGRFRDQIQTVVQAELRFPIYWRFKGVAFSSLGNVANDFASLTDDVKFNYGAGVRFLLSKNDQLHIRADYGRSNEGGAFYLTIGEAF